MTRSVPQALDDSFEFRTLPERDSGLIELKLFSKFGGNRIRDPLLGELNNLCPRRNQTDHFLSSFRTGTR